MSAINWWLAPVDAPLHIHDQRRSAAFVGRHQKLVSPTHATERVTTIEDESNFAVGVALLLPSQLQERHQLKRQQTAAEV